jgi:hypothetical protein
MENEIIKKNLLSQKTKCKKDQRNQNQTIEKGLIIKVIGQSKKYY